MVKNSINLPIVVIGDMNEVLSQDEGNGGNGCIGSIEEIKNWVMEMGAYDLPLCGRKSTWGHGRSRSILDRMMVDLEWNMKFLDMLLKALPSLVSNHTSLLLKLERSIRGYTS